MTHVKRSTATKLTKIMHLSDQWQINHIILIYIYIYSIRTFVHNKLGPNQPNLPPHKLTHRFAQGCENAMVEKNKEPGTFFLTIFFLCETKNIKTTSCFFHLISSDKYSDSKNWFLPWRRHIWHAWSYLSYSSSPPYRYLYNMFHQQNPALQ